MNTHAAGTFEIESWDEKPYEMQEGIRLTRTRLIKTLAAMSTARVTAELLMAYGFEGGSAAYVGLERVTGRVHGRFGSFVLWHNAAMERGEGKFSLDVVAEPGTGELRGLRGEARICVEPGGGHSFTLDYDLE
jgi:Protein of unknown function (DUF3224)